jgi:putative redox protein
MDINVTFPGGKRITAQVGAHHIETDQPIAFGGEDAAPAPFELFLASIATCAGLYALGFLQARDLPTEGLAIHQHVETDPETGTLARVFVDLTLPADFPSKYRDPIIRAMENCKVKKAMTARPAVEIVIRHKA